VLRQKAEEIALKLDLEFTPLNGWFDWFRKHAVLSYRAMRGEFRSAIQEEVGT
jgi:hypothetical protein